MRSPQNDYAYIGFHDKDGTEQIADINVQRTGANTGHMVFSTNNGSGGSETRLRIADSGRLCYSPDSNFTAESTNIAMSIIASGGDIAGYPGINIRSTDSGGGTNSQNGMSIITTDGNWSLYTNSGNVHGLGLFAGNSATIVVYMFVLIKRSQWVQRPTMRHSRRTLVDRQYTSLVVDFDWCYK